MNITYAKTKKESKMGKIIKDHVENNIKEYVIISIIFFIGIIIGIIYINNTSDVQKLDINNYILSFIDNIKANGDINEISLLINSIKGNCILALLLWFIGSTVIGMLLVYLLICFRGFCLGYTISSIIMTCGTRQGFDISFFNYIFTKYFIYTCNISIGCKWNEITYINHEG